MATHSAMSHILPQVIDGFKIEIDSDVVYPEYMNETNFISIEGNSLLDLNTDTFVVDLNQSLIPSNSDGIPLSCGEQRNISENASNKQHSVYSSGLRPSHYLHPHESHSKGSQSETNRRIQESNANGKPPNSFYTRCTNMVSPEVTGTDNNPFHYSQNSWDIQNAPLDLSLPKGQGGCLKPPKPDTDESTKKDSLVPLSSDPVYLKDNHCIAAEDKSEHNTVPAHVVHRPIPTYPTLFHSHSINGTRDLSNFSNNSIPNNSWHNETWSRNLSRDPNLTVQWGCCDKYLWHNSFKNDEKHETDFIGKPINKSYPNGYPRVYDSNSFSPPSSGLAQTIVPEDSLTCGLANPLPLNRGYQEVASSVVFQPGLIDSRQQGRHYVQLDATKMSSDMTCRQTVNIHHRAAQAPVGLRSHESAVINLDSEFMDLDQLPLKEKKCKLPVPRPVTVTNEFRYTHDDVTEDKLQNERNLTNQSRGSPKWTPFKTNITNKSGKDCGNFIIFPPINKTLFRHTWTSRDNHGENLASMSIKRKRKRSTGRNQALDENKQPFEETFNDKGLTKVKRGNQPLEETFNDNGLSKAKLDNQHLNRYSIREDCKIERKHPGSHCSNDSSNKISQHKKEDKAENSEKLVASFVCVNCKLQCDSLFSLLEHQQKECQYVRKVCHATDCLGKAKEEDCQCTNCSLCKGIFNSKFRVFSHCLKGCYMRHSYCFKNDSLQKLLIATTEASIGNNKDGNGGEEGLFQKRKQKPSEDELNQSMELLRAKYELWKGLEGRDKHDINKSLEEPTEKCAGNNIQGIVNCDVDSKILPRHSSTETRTCGNQVVKLKPDEIKALSPVDNLQLLKTVSFGNIKSNKESEIAFNVKDASSRIKSESCPTVDVLGKKPVLGTLEPGNEQTKNDAMNNIADGNSLEINQRITKRCKTPENSLDKEIRLTEIKIEVENIHFLTSVNDIDRNNLNHTENNIQQDTVVLQRSEKQHTAETISPIYDTRAFPTPAIKTEPPSQDFSSTCESQDKSTQSSPIRPQKLPSRAYHNSDVCAGKGWSEIRADLGLRKGGVQEALPRLSLTGCDSELRTAVKKTRRVRRCKSDVAGLEKGKRVVAGMESGSPKIPSAIAFGASQRINKNGEKEKITYLLDANSKPIMLVEKEQKENSIMKCEKCLQCFPTFLFLTWHAKYTCPFSVTPRRGRPKLEDKI